MRTCSLNGCGAKHYGHGLCQMHWQRRNRGKNLATPKRRRISGSRCSIPGCGRKHFGRSYCRAHYERWYRGASLDGPIRTDLPCALCGSPKDGRRNTEYCSPECSRLAWSIHRYVAGVESLTTRDQAKAVRKARALLAIGYRRLSQCGPTKPGAFAVMRRGSLFHIRWMDAERERWAA